MKPRPLSHHELRRIELTVAGADTRAIPKVARAGEVEDRDGTRVQIMHNGVVVEEGCYYGAWMTEIIRRLRGHHEPQEERAFHAVVERLSRDTRAPAMIELGSFWGYYSLWLAHAIFPTTCMLVEPDPANLEVGRRNFTLNGVKGRFVHAAVGAPHGAVAPFACESDGMVRDVERITVDGLLAREGLERADVLLCDTQGAELEALHGAVGAIAERRLRFLFVSTHHHSISGDPLTHQRCLEELRAYGAHIIAEHTVYESCSGDGLIVASLDPRDADMHVELTRARAADTLFGEPEAELAAALARVAELERLIGGDPPELRRRWSKLRGP